MTNNTTPRGWGERSLEHPEHAPRHARTDLSPAFFPPDAVVDGTRACGRCGQPFTPPPRAPHARFCQDACRKAAHDARQRGLRESQVWGPPGTVHAAVLRALVALDAQATVDGLLALHLAHCIDGAPMTGAALVAVDKQLGERMRRITATHPGQDSPLDILRRRREVTNRERGWAQGSKTNATPAIPDADGE